VSIAVLPALRAYPIEKRLGLMNLPKMPKKRGFALASVVTQRGAVLQAGTRKRLPLHAE